MNKTFVKIMKKILLLSLAVMMIGLNCMCSKQENTIRNLVVPPTIPEGESCWGKLGEFNKDTISVLYECRSGQIGLHSEITIKRTDINGKEVYTSVIDNLSEGQWRVLNNSFSFSNTMFLFFTYRQDQAERRDSTESRVYVINGNTGKLLDATPKIFFKDYLAYKSYLSSEDSYTFIQNAWDNGYLFYVNRCGEDKWVRRMTNVENYYDRNIGFIRYSDNYIIVNGKLVYDISGWHKLHIMDIKSATVEMSVSVSLHDDKENTGIFYRLESADFSGDTLAVTYNKYCHTPVIEKKQDPITGEWIEKITGYEDVLQGKILYHISYPDGKVLDKQEQESAS